ncbi:MAG: SH3 domain-containing protein [Anaerolineae bacterium]|nr:SH3 domain-containing protein [Anaerolineae bacterium]
MKHLPFTLCALLLLLAAPVMAAADCPALVRQAFAATDSVCQNTDSNQACYGNSHLQAKSNGNIPNFTFSQPGDRVNLSDVKSLQLSPMTLDTGEWGVALMHIQANLSAKSNKNLMLLAFGDVAIENTAPTPTAADVQVGGKEAVNVRLLPNVKAGAVAVLQPGQQVTAVERLADNSWLRINLPDSGETGWIRGDLITTTNDLRSLNVTQADQPNYRPMQAFTFSSGNDQQNCAEIPQDGLIIQTPEGAGEVRLWINQVVVKLGSTVYFQAQPNGDMIITTLEGHATVEALGISYTAVAGTSVRVKLDADMKPVAPPRLPESYSVAAVQNLPVSDLQRPIAIHAPLTDAQVAVVQAQQQTQSVVSTVTTLATDTVGAVADTAAAVVNGTVNTVGTVVDSVGNTVSDVVNGGDSTDTGSGSSDDSSGDNDGGGLVDTILNLPCTLLLCK